MRFLDYLWSWCLKHLWVELGRCARGRVGVDQFLDEGQLVAETATHVQLECSWCGDNGEVALAKSEDLRDSACLFVGQLQPKHCQHQDETDLKDGIAARQCHERTRDIAAQ